MAGSRQVHALLEQIERRLEPQTALFELFYRLLEALEAVFKARMVCLRA